MTNNPINGRKLTNKQQLDRLTTFCLDRWDLAAARAGRADLADREHDRRLEQVRGQRWHKRACRYSQLKEWI